MTHRREWPKHRLGEVADLCLGKMLDKKKNRGELHPYLGNIHVRWGRFDLADLPQMRFEEREHERYGLKRGDLVVCEGGEPGRCALWDGQVPNMKIQKALHRVRPHACLESRYLLYWFLWAGQRSYFDQFVTGATIKHLPGEKLARVEIDLPDLPTQRKIADILSAYDDLIENNLRRIKILEDMVQSLYREWFVHFRFPGHESVPLVDSAVGPIPEGWEVVSLAKLMDIKGGSQPPKSRFIHEPSEGYTRLIQIRDYQTDSHITFVPSSKNLRLCEPEDVMIARYGASVARVCWGLRGAYNVALAKAVMAEDRCREFIRWYLASEETQTLLIGMTGRAAQAGFNKSDIAAITLAIPKDRTLLGMFEEFASPICQAILVQRKRNQSLRQTRDLLLPKLLNPS